MTVTPRADVPFAYTVQSGENLYDVYCGPDVSLPRCSCAAHTYRESHCRHLKAVEEYRCA